MWKATNVWPGVGVYTPDELYWITGVYHVYSLIFAVDHPTTPGIPHFSTEGEVFNNPSQAVCAYLELYE
jgi:hypothetical protein